MALCLFQDWISEWSGSLFWCDWWQDLTGKETCTKDYLIQWVPGQNTAAEQKVKAENFLDA